MELVIGTPAWSTWSMRPWLALRRVGAPFTVRTIALRRGEATRAAILPHSPSGKVPALIDGPLVVWDSLAICEYLAERFPDAGLWPDDTAARATARSAVAEMHSGFQSLRNECPMDLLAKPRAAELSPETVLNVRRIVELWRDLRGRFGADGPYLMGQWSIADAFYAPVASRFHTYAVDLAAADDDGTAAAYRNALLASEEVAAWFALARAHPPLAEDTRR